MKSLFPGDKGLPKIGSPAQYDAGIVKLSKGVDFGYLYR